jgi:hypothetical protein
VKLTTKRPGLSKSRIAAFEQCPKRLWLLAYRPDLKTEDQAAQARFAVGNEIGRIARDLSVGGVLVEAQPSLSAALAQTASLLSSGHRAPIYEATFEHDGVLVQADVIEPMNGGSWRLAEVKSSSSAKDYHIGDVATQAWVMGQAGISLSDAVVRHIDTSFVLRSPGEYLGLLVDTDVTAQIQPLVARRSDTVSRARETLQGPEPAREIGDHCDAPFECEFKAYCGRDLPQGPEWPISLLPRTGKRIAAQWAIDGLYDLRDLRESDLTNSVHRRIHRATSTGQPFHDVEAIKHATASWRYPMHYLDFETIAPAIPRWVGTRPFQQIPFQYSCHTETEGGEVTHADFLSLDEADPRRSIALALIAILHGDDARAGSIVAYNASFERRCLLDLAAALPDLAEPLHDIASRLVDLLPITRTNFYHPDQRGSWSIKSVVAALMPDMSYSELVVGDGNAAQLAWLEAVAPGTPAERRRDLDRALRVYCERDTLAMVMLLRRLQAIR